MTTQGQIIIPLSKAKLTFMLIVSVGFVIAGIYFVFSPETFVSSYRRSSTFIFIVGLASITFFGLVGFYIIRKLFDNTPGLIISKHGILDNSGGVSAGQIDWADIKKISTSEIQQQKVIWVHVKNPKTYIERQTSLISRKAMDLNNKYYGTPISISSNGLKIKFEELHKLLTDNFNINRQ